MEIGKSEIEKKLTDGGDSYTEFQQLSYLNF